jgi:hypothetical protein
VRPLAFGHDEALERLCAALDGFGRAAADLDDLELLDPSLCRGWSRLEVVTHVRMGVEELAVGTTQLTGDAPDHDAASYWESHPDDRDDDPVPHLMWLRRVAGAYGRPSAAVDHLANALRSAAAAARAMPEGTVAFQGKRLTTGDFLGTWVVELAVHALDLRASTDPVGLDWARRTVEAIADADLPDHVDDRSAVLAGLGRVPLTAEIPPAFPVSL